MILPSILPLDLSVSRREHLAAVAVTCTSSAESTGVEGEDQPPLVQQQVLGIGQRIIQAMNTQKTFKNYKSWSFNIKIESSQVCTKGSTFMGLVAIYNRGARGAQVINVKNRPGMYYPSYWT